MDEPVIPWRTRAAFRCWWAYRMKNGRARDIETLILLAAVALFWWCAVALMGRG